jgi:uncharacterized membrane protein
MMKDERLGVSRVLPRLGYLPIIMLLVCIALARSFIFQSLWLDETVTYWVTSDGLCQAISRATQFQGQSPFYYVLVWLVRQALGGSEFVMRAPSILALALSGWVFYRLALGLIGRELASIALLFFVTHDGFLRAMNARPYALALLFALCASFCLMRWLENGNWRWWLGYVMSLVLTIYAHYLFAGVVLLHCGWLLWTSGGKPGRFSWFVLALLLAALGLMPCYRQLRSLGSNVSNLIFSSSPHFSDLLSALFPKAQMLALLTGILVALVFFFKAKTMPLELGGRLLLSRRVFWLSLLWWAAAPLLFFIWSRHSGNGLFVERYFLWQIPGLSLALALLIGMVNPGQARTLLMAVACALLLVHELDRRWVIEDWRGALSDADQRYKGQPAPVLFYSGLIEAEGLSAGTSGETWAYLEAPLSAYPAAFGPYLIPANLSSGANREYLEGQIWPEIEKAGGAWMVYFNRRSLGGNPEASVEQDYQGYFAERGYAMRILSEKGLVRLARISRGE